MQKGFVTTVESQLVVLGQAVTLWNTLGRIRTCDRSIRSRMLYPAELQGRMAAKDKGLPSECNHKKTACRDQGKITTSGIYLAIKKMISSGEADP